MKSLHLEEKSFKIRDIKSEKNQKKIIIRNYSYPYIEETKYLKTYCYRNCKHFYNSSEKLKNLLIINNCSLSSMGIKQRKKKLYNLNNNNIHKIIIGENSKNPGNMRFLKNLITDSYSFCYIDNIFIVFRSINNISCLIYTNKNKAIISYDLIDNKKVNIIKNAHNNYITNFRHYLDKYNKRDLIISISCHDNNIKLWNINNWECLHNFVHIYNSGQLFSACFLKDNNQIYIISGNSNFNNSEPIKILEFNGNILKEIENSNDNIFFIDTFYDKYLYKSYIITGNFGFVKSYDYMSNKLYHIYNYNDSRSHNSIIINYIEKDVHLIESNYDGEIRIWNFHSGDLLNIIRVINNLYNICLWNNEYLFVGCENGMLKLIKIKNGEIIKNLMGHTKSILTIKKITHPIYKECLISQGKDQRIILWINKC